MAKKESKTVKEPRRGRPTAPGGWTARQLKDAARYYFARCDNRTRMIFGKEGKGIEVGYPAPYTVEGFCNHLGVTTVAFRNWCREENERGEAARLIRQRITENRVTGALDGTQNGSFARFMLTNNEPEEYSEKVKVEADVSEDVKSVLDLLGGSANRVPES